jgi:hypothetical protein
VAESKEDQIARLLAEGLEHYGCDEIVPAIKAWRAVMSLDPSNTEALDFLQTADRRDQRRLPVGDQMSDSDRRMVHQVNGMIQNAEWEAALDLLRSRSDSEPTALEYEATVEIVRSRLLRRYTERVGNLDGIPSLKDGTGDLTRHDLPSDAGFMLSLIDGTTGMADLISLSGMDAFEALRIVGSLLDSDILEMRS